MSSSNVGKIPGKRIRCAGCNTYKKPGSGSLVQQDVVDKETVDDHLYSDGTQDVSQDDTGSASDAESHSSEEDDGILEDTNGMGDRFLAGASAVGSGLLSKAKHLKNRMTGTKTKIAASFPESDGTGNHTSTVTTPGSPDTLDKSDVAEQVDEDGGEQEQVDEDGGEQEQADEDGSEQEQADEDGSEQEQVDEGGGDAVADTTDYKESLSDDIKQNNVVDETAFGYFPDGQSIKKAISSAGHAMGSAGAAVLHIPGNIVHMMSSMHEPSFESDDDHTALHEQSFLRSTHAGNASPYTGPDDPRLHHIFNPIPYSGRHVDRL